MSEIKSDLKDVLTRVVDSADGYESAAEDATDTRFALMFREQATQRRGFATEIRNHLNALGEQVDEDGSLLAAGHRVFKGLRDAVTGSDDAAVLAEVDRGETHLLKTYDDALEDIPTDAPAYGVLSAQRRQVNDALARVKGMES